LAHILVADTVGVTSITLT